MPGQPHAPTFLPRHVGDVPRCAVFSRTEPSVTNGSTARHSCTIGDHYCKYRPVTYCFQKIIYSCILLFVLILKDPIIHVTRARVKASVNIAVLQIHKAFVWAWALLVRIGGGGRDFP